MDLGGGNLGVQDANIRGGPIPVQDLLGALAVYMEEHNANQGGHGSTKALKAVVTKIGRFDGKNISKFLRIYVCEMEIHSIDEDRMMETFNMAVIPDIRDRVHEIRTDAITWAEFAERLRDEYFDEDTERMTKRAFLDWVEQRPGVNMGPNELLRDFEKKYGQLPMAERRLLDSRKTELFLHAADDALEDRLLLLLGDRTTEGGFTNDWRRVEETVILLAKQQRVRSRGVETKVDVGPIHTPRHSKVSFAPTLTPAPAPSSVPILKATKSTDGEALEEIIKGFRELRVEMSELRRAHTSGSLQRSDGPREYPWRCIFCDKTEKETSRHRLRECLDCDEAVKDGTIIFIEGKVHDAATKSPLGTNFGRGGMKKLLEDRMSRTSSVYVRGAETYHIGVEAFSAGTSLHQTQVVMKRGAEAIRSATGWNDPVEVNTIKAFLNIAEVHDEMYEASVEEKRSRAEAEDNDEPLTKRRNPTQGTAPKEPRQRVPTRSRTTPDLGQAHNTPLETWDEISGATKDRQTPAKAKAKGPAYKLQSDIETATDLKGILEERILDAKIEFTLRETLGIAKKDFHELIIDIIKRKRQMTAEAVMVSALDTHMTRDEEVEIGEVFAMMGDLVVQDHRATYDHVGRKKLEGVDVSNIHTNSSSSSHFKEGSNPLTYMEAVLSKTAEVEVKTFECTSDHTILRKDEDQFEYTQPFWARATTETRVKLGGLQESVLALVDHGSEINIISRELYEKGKWPIDTEHGWIMRAANSGRTRLYGACPALSTKIGDIEVEQNFFVQNSGAYPVLLGQPFITASRMETKVLDDGSHYARIRSVDGKKTVQFLTVKADNDRHRVQLREGPLPTTLGFSDF